MNKFPNDLEETHNLHCPFWDGIKGWMYSACKTGAAETCCELQGLPSTVRHTKFNSNYYYYCCYYSM